MLNLRKNPYYSTQNYKSILIIILCRKIRIFSQVEHEAIAKQFFSLYDIHRKTGCTEYAVFTETCGFSYIRKNCAKIVQNYRTVKLLLFFFFFITFRCFPLKYAK